MTDTLASLRDECEGVSICGAEYDAKMMHKVPDVPSVDRVQYILNQCRDKVVLHLGCVGDGSP